MEVAAHIYEAHMNLLFGQPVLSNVGRDIDLRIRQELVLLVMVLLVAVARVWQVLTPQKVG